MKVRFKFKFIDSTKLLQHCLSLLIFLTSMAPNLFIYLVSFIGQKLYGRYYIQGPDELLLLLLSSIQSFSSPLLPLLTSCSHDLSKPDPNLCSGRNQVFLAIVTGS